MADQTHPGYDGCSRDCRTRGTHTLAWGFCEHAAEPEPTVTFMRPFTASDGKPAIGTVTFTVPDLAAELEPILRFHGCSDPATVAEAVAAHLAQKVSTLWLTRPRRESTCGSPPQAGRQCSCVHAARSGCRTSSSRKDHASDERPDPHHPRDHRRRHRSVTAARD